MPIEDVTAYFKNLSPEGRLKWKARYEQLLDIENDRYVPPVNRITGKQMAYPAKMPQMKPHWEKGLEILNEIIDANR